MEQFYVGQAAKLLGIHPSTLRDLENRGMIEVQRNWSGFRIYTLDQINELKKILYPKSGYSHGETSHSK